MPVPLDELNRALIPRVLTPGTTVTELLYLFAQQPQPHRCSAVVRVGRDEYDVLALEDLREFAQGHPVGEILWRLRRHYLDTHHTILAFNYSLYCLGEVRLAPPLLTAA